MLPSWATPHNIFIYGSLAAILGVVAYYGYGSLQSIEANNAAAASAAATQASQDQEASEAEAEIGEQVLFADTNSTGTTTGATSSTTPLDPVNVAPTVPIQEFTGAQLAAIAGPVATIPTPALSTS